MALDRDIIEKLGSSLTRRRRTRIARELRSHIAESSRDLRMSGWDPESAAREAESRLGDMGEIASAFSDVYRKPKRRTQLALAISLATGMLLGVYGIGGTFASARVAHHPAPAAHHRLSR
ncbi:MAG: permease prefix domain 1-containing protein [Chloroflexota bacterium]